MAVIIGLLFALPLAVGLALLRAWPVMLVIGGLHHEVDPAIPPVGLFGSLLISLLFTLLIPTGSSGSDD